MAGPNLEVFKFGLYLFVPVFALLHFGDPDWYHHNVLPVSSFVLRLFVVISYTSCMDSIKKNYSRQKRKHTPYIYTLC